MFQVNTMNRHFLLILSFNLCIPFTTLLRAESQPAAFDFRNNLKDGNYRFCSQRPRSGTVTAPNEVVGNCFLFRKQRGQVIGKYYDTRSFGEVSVCLSGSVTDRVLAQGLEEIGGIGRQRIPANLMGDELVNWDKEGILKVSGAETYRGTSDRGRLVRYRQAILDLKRLYRVNAGAILPPTRCF
ncbi:hypothetical protein NC981_11620 [Leptolyngbya sp. DQ-M1]